MNKVELAAALAEKCSLTKKDAVKLVDATIEIITDTLKSGEKVSLMGFGAFDVRARAPRTGRNPATREAIEIPASKAPAFKPGKALKEAVK